MWRICVVVSERSDALQCLLQFFDGDHFHAWDRLTWYVPFWHDGAFKTMFYSFFNSLLTGGDRTDFARQANLTKYD